jgi:phosphoribosylglycinamide formyltransferase-1
MTTKTRFRTQDFLDLIFGFFLSTLMKSIDSDLIARKAPLMKPLRLGFLASHGGSNMQAILDSIQAGALDAVPALAISNNSKSTALERARAEGIPWKHLSSATHPDPDDLDRAILAALREQRVNLVILAGYMKKIGAATLGAYANRILNIHPALLPKFGGKGMYGMNVHEAVLAAGETVSGATIHLVDPLYDHGRILARRETPVEPGDTPETLQARVLKAEHRLYSDTIQAIASGEIDLDEPAKPGTGASPLRSA